MVPNGIILYPVVKSTERYQSRTAKIDSLSFCYRDGTGLVYADFILKSWRACFGVYYVLQYYWMVSATCLRRPTLTVCQVLDKYLRMPISLESASRSGPIIGRSNQGLDGGG